MTPRTRRLALVALVAVAAIATALDGQQAVNRQPTPIPTAAATMVPALGPARPSVAQLNRQDRVGAAHRRRETRAYDDRPLLAVLPLELAGVRIDIAGLAADGRTTELIIRPGAVGRDHARALFRRALAAYGDSGLAYTVRWAR